MTELKWRGMRDESRPRDRTERDGMKKFADLAGCGMNPVPGQDGTGRDEKICRPSRTGRDKKGRDAGRNGIGLIHYFVPHILVKRNRLKILWVHRILTTPKH